MRIFLTLLMVLVAGGIAMTPYPHSPVNGLVAGAVVYLLVTVSSLRRRIGKLEETVAAAARTATQPAGEEAGEPAEAELPIELDEAPVMGLPPTKEMGSLPPVEAMPPSPPPADAWLDRLRPLFAWFTGGNPVLKAGLVVLFFGVAFLLKYAAQRNLIPLELRLTGVALGGLALLVVGWRLRHSKPVYGLGLEGGGIGILYLVVFAGAKLYQLVPMELAMAVMIGLVALSCTLAILQDGRSLAVFGSVGGFLAPVLLSTGGGSHVILFSYYALLGAGILGVAWFKAWRELNLVGFVFTFGIGSLWGASAYTPAHFATTEPFLILFFVMYCLIAVLFAHRQPLNLRGFIDGPLVFGLPIVTAGLQAYLVRDIPFGMALSALALGGWYIGLALLLWRRLAEEMRLVTEAFLALGVVFASLAIPLGLDPHWTTGVWALEGAAMIWVGVRQQRTLARLFGLLLQFGAAMIFFDQPASLASGMLFANRTFLGAGLIGTAALLSSFWLDRNRGRAKPWETMLPHLLLAWGLIWWYCGGFRDLDRHLNHQELAPCFVLFVCATTLGLAWVSERLGWQRLIAALLLQLPFMTLALVDRTFGWHTGGLLAGYGLLAWPLAFVLQYGLLHRFESRWPARLLPIWHSLCLWLLIAAITVEAVWQVDRIPNLTAAWSLACWGAVPLVLLFSLRLWGDRLRWPVGRFGAAYHGIGTDGPLVALALWLAGSFAVNGNPAPLPYIPFLNPLELIELAILLLAMLRCFSGRSAGFSLRPGRITVTGLFLFAFLNVVIARSVHFFAAVDYRFDTLFGSSVFQAAIAGLWAVLALVLTVWGARKHHRRLWLAGAGLLALTVLKLFFIDLSGTGAIGRIISFLVVGLLMLLIGFFAPLPPSAKETRP